jgi:hypothetical protein
MSRRKCCCPCECARCSCALGGFPASLIARVNGLLPGVYWVPTVTCAGPPWNCQDIFAGTPNDYIDQINAAAYILDQSHPGSTNGYDEDMMPCSKNYWYDAILFFSGLGPKFGLEISVHSAGDDITYCDPRIAGAGKFLESAPSLYAYTVPDGKWSLVARMGLKTLDTDPCWEPWFPQSYCSDSATMIFRKDFDSQPACNLLSGCSDDIVLPFFSQMNLGNGPGYYACDGRSATITLPCPASPGG